MLCQQCHQNPATIHMNIQLNHQVKKLNICQSCMAKMRKQYGTGSSLFSQLPLMNDWLQTMNSQMSSMNPTSHAHVTEAPDQSSELLDGLGRNLSQAAKAGKIDPVIGRDQEVERVIEILNRRNKNNPVLIGEPGVGKTAIAEGLALKIVNGEVPAKLLGKTVYTLDISSLVAGTGIRGQFEEKMQQLIQELQNREDVILFIDELHLLVGAGSAEGSMDAGNILKPALARGDLQVMGATTMKEYRKIEKDAALERRFQPVIVKEPSVEETLEILKGIREKYEQYHGVQFSNEVLQACVQLSHRYIQDRFLPDKAIDLLDEAGSKANLLGVSQDANAINAELAKLAVEKQEATKQEDYERAAKLRDREIELQKQLAEKQGDAKAAVSVEDIQEIVEKKTGIPVRKLQQDEQQRMKDLALNLGAKVIGQPEAVEKVAKAIRRSRAGLKPKNRPIASFLFVGPTGVGKTELTKCLAEELFGSKDAMIRLDMSEFMEKHSVSKLIGSPPGYVGHEEAGQLTEKVRRNPYSLILLDEIEKAHPDVQNMFLQIFEDGRLTDSQGRTVNFKDTVIIMTSNAGSTEKRITVGFGSEDQETQTFISALGAYFRPEFLNRLDAIIPFHHLQEEHLVKIVDLLMKDVVSSLAEQGIELSITEAAKEKLAQLGYDPAFGARPLRRVIQEHVEDQIADLLMEEEAVQSVKIDLVDDRIAVVSQ